MSTDNTLNIKNKRASFEYSFIDTYTAGIQLSGTEIKSIREGKTNINDAFCVFSLKFQPIVNEPQILSDR